MYPIPTRKQQVMSRLPDAEILYFDPAVSLIAPFKDKSAWKQLTKYHKKGDKPQENITVYSLRPCCRFSTRAASSTSSTSAAPRRSSAKK